MLKTLIGNLFVSQAQTLVNTVNCVGVMGKGVAQKFKEQYPVMFDDYVKRCDRGEVRLGRPYPFSDSSGKIIVNFPTKNHWRSPSRLSDIEQGLDFFVSHFAEWGISTVAFPPLGCGNGGLEWSEVGPLMFKKLHTLDAEIEIYAPYGTPGNQLTAEFLGKPFQMELEGKGQRPDKLVPEWVVLTEVLRELERQPYARPVGRTIFQKICYVMTEIGVETGFKFDKGSYGPFAGEVKQALHVFANKNWVREERLGKMLALRIGEQYERERLQYPQILEKHQQKIEKVVDLFSRIKSTDQAEELFTVLFASRQLRKANPDREVAEEDLLEVILDWKKRWRNEEKEAALSRAIRNLVMLGWMRLTFSETLPPVI